MANKESDSDRLSQRYRALSRWENEGGSGFAQQQLKSPEDDAVDAPPLTNTELVQLRVRVIALENLVIALLAGASDLQLEVAGDMATFILPRPSFTHHPMTLHAAAQMTSLVERSGKFRA